MTARTISRHSPGATPRFSTSGCSPASIARRPWPARTAAPDGSSRTWRSSRGSHDAFRERHQITARLAHRVGERAARGPSQLQAIACTQLMLDVALAEVQPAVEHPDQLLDERVTVGGEGGPCPGWELDLDELHRATGRRHGAAYVTGVRIGPRG